MRRIKKAKEEMQAWDFLSKIFLKMKEKIEEKNHTFLEKAKEKLILFEV